MKWFNWLLYPLMGLYRFAVMWRNRAYDRDPKRTERLPIFVISIGNLTTGGTGKTPLTLAIASWLKLKAFRPLIVSRGYKGSQEGPVWVERNSQPAAMGDEPCVLAQTLGDRHVVVSRKRSEGIRFALKDDPSFSVALLDDGFQHRALYRDLDLLVLDGRDGVKNQALLPVGRLREPLANAKRADVCIVTRSSLCESPSEIQQWWMSLNPNKPIFFTDFKIKQLRSWNDNSYIKLDPAQPQPQAIAWCGLGNPMAFIDDLFNGGQPLIHCHVLADHEPLSSKELKKINLLGDDLKVPYLICSEKDAVKIDLNLKSQPSLPIYIAEQTLEGMDPFWKWLEHHLNQS